MKKKKAIPKNQHVIPVGNGWAVKGEGNVKFSVITDSKREAVAFAKEIAMHNRSELIVYSKEGRIVERNSYVKRHPVSKVG